MWDQITILKGKSESTFWPQMQDSCFSSPSVRFELSCVVFLHLLETCLSSFKCIFVFLWPLFLVLQETRQLFNFSFPRNENISSNRRRCLNRTKDSLRVFPFLSGPFQISQWLNDLIFQFMESGCTFFLLLPLCLKECLKAERSLMFYFFPELDVDFGGGESRGAGCSVFLFFLLCVLCWRNVESASWAQWQVWNQSVREVKRVKMKRDLKKCRWSLWGIDYKIKGNRVIK